MTSQTQQLMRELRNDHRNMAIVLNLLQDIIADARSDKDPNFELADEIMRYMTIYPDAVHHPKEDSVYEKLRTQRPDLATGLEDVPEDHQQIARLGLQLRADIEAINAGAAVRRDKFIDDCESYVLRLRDHMRWEEDDLFLRIDQMLAADPDSAAVDTSQYIKDPVFELEVEAGFRRLMSSLSASN